ncbi:hypothetical protein ACIRRA_43150, partial [Nocardia sp. NPDC101769]|uniref:hypothetical protein n=1 Tax=Nocardia sp. NPDC101769 TaxID=3364333 RepID=UPI0038245F14
NDPSTSPQRTEAVQAQRKSPETTSSTGFDNISSRAAVGQSADVSTIRDSRSDSAATCSTSRLPKTDWVATVERSFASASSMAANYEAQLNRWETFHDIRTVAAVLAFILLTAVEMANRETRAGVAALSSERNVLENATN